MNKWSTGSGEDISFEEGGSTKVLITALNKAKKTKSELIQNIVSIHQ